VELCIPASTGKIIDSALHPNTSRTTMSTMTLLMGLFGVMALAAYLTFIRSIWQAQAGYAFTCRIRQQTYTCILCQDKAFFDSMKQGDLLSRLAANADLIQQAVASQALNLVRSILISFCAILLLLYTSWSLALIAMTVLPPTMFLARRMGCSMKEQHGRVRELHGHATSFGEQALTCLSTVQQFCAEGFEARQYHKAVQEAHNTAVSTVVGIRSGHLNFPKPAIHGGYPLDRVQVASLQRCRVYHTVEKRLKSDSNILALSKLHGRVYVFSRSQT
jgi:ABC-type multidrug transport system fused ATPase/permease subunit